jgi:mono/diheme cytochrome c family protein
VSRPGAHRWLGAIVAAVVAAGCATAGRDGLDAAQLPAAIRPDYAVFARRCSKCHQLARPLGSGIHDDALWVDYVERMRRQPGSGISRADTVPILRFLHYYSHDYGVSLAGGRGSDGGRP